jgi:hypothetical protein
LDTEAERRVGNLARSPEDAAGRNCDRGIGTGVAAEQPILAPIAVSNLLVLGANKNECECSLVCSGIIDWVELDRRIGAGDGRGIGDEIVVCLIPVNLNQPVSSIA